MTRMKLHEGAEQPAAPAQEVGVIVDPAGRRIALKDPGVLAEYRLVELLGKTAENAVYMGMALPLLWVTSIDGELVAFPTSRRQLDALIERLGGQGVRAVLQEVASRNAPGGEGEETERSAIKNS